MNQTQGHSNRVLTMVCDAIDQKVARTHASQQPQYSGPFKTVNTKCCMSATSSRMPLFVHVFQKKTKLAASGDSIPNQNRTSTVHQKTSANGFIQGTKSTEDVPASDAPRIRSSNTTEQDFLMWQIRRSTSVPRLILPLIRTAAVFRFLTSR